LIGLDTSFLVGLTIREHPAHEHCWRLFEEKILGHEASAAIAPQVLAEFAHVITDPRRFEQPLDMLEATDICKQWWHAAECRALTPTPEAVNIFLVWMNRYRLGRKRILDTLLAATYHSAGVTRIASTNWRDFSCFDVFAIELLE
jgi:predicted nucleic acid-binding protein